MRDKGDLPSPGGDSPAQRAISPRRLQHDLNKLAIRQGSDPSLMSPTFPKLDMDLVSGKSDNNNSSQMAHGRQPQHRPPLSGSGRSSPRGGGVRKSQPGSALSSPASSPRSISSPRVGVASPRGTPRVHSPRDSPRGARDSHSRQSSPRSGPGSPRGSPREKYQKREIILAMEVAAESIRTNSQNILNQLMPDTDYFVGSFRRTPFNVSMFPLALNGYNRIGCLDLFDAEAGSLWRFEQIVKPVGCFRMRCCDPHFTAWLGADLSMVSEQEDAGVWLFDTHAPFRDGPNDVGCRIYSVDGRQLCSRDKRKSLHLVRSKELEKKNTAGEYVFNVAWELTPDVADEVDDFIEKYLAPTK
eukprot:GFYU01013265.1.p1 GENE.GFYU01013265.1~~GFYU01013265.1.p1  ORF type:complete len:357 (+),score=40.33 GFYU01013265.1:84-1154(+)